MCTVNCASGASSTVEAKGSPIGFATVRLDGALGRGIRMRASSADEFVGEHVAIDDWPPDTVASKYAIGIGGVSAMSVGTCVDVEPPRTVASKPAVGSGVLISPVVCTV